MIDPAVRVVRGPGLPLFAWTVALTSALSPTGMAQEPPAAAAPRFEDGEAQEVEAFSDPKEWIREQLWVETGFDSDGDGKPDRMHVDVTRPKQTANAGLKVPVIYETSPYFAGTGGTDAAYFWNPSHALGATPPVRGEMPPIPFRTPRGMIANSEVQTWVPRGFAVVHSSSPGTGLSQGCPTVGGDNESLAPKAVIDWLNGRAKGYTSPTAASPSWPTGARARSA
jgi:X-Pro dipeptidyl-peptidase